MESVCLVADCLKSYDKYREINIMMRLGPTLTGDKPMHILCFNKDFKFINQILNDIHLLFKDCRNVRYRIVYSHNNSIKIVFYNTATIEKLLNIKRNRFFLCKQGYSKSFNGEDFMDLLSGDLENNQLPPEYGLFFGYPLKDVMGFMGGHPKLQHVKTTAWKVYGNPEQSDVIFKRFKEAEKRVLALCQTQSLPSVIAELKA